MPPRQVILDSTYPISVKHSGDELEWLCRYGYKLNWPGWVPTKEYAYPADTAEVVVRFIVPYAKGITPGEQIKIVESKGWRPATLLELFEVVDRYPGMFDFEPDESTAYGFLHDEDEKHSGHINKYFFMSLERIWRPSDGRAWYDSAYPSIDPCSKESYERYNLKHSGVLGFYRDAPRWNDLPPSTDYVEDEKFYKRVCPLYPFTRIAIVRK